MWSLLQKPSGHAGRVYYRGPLAPTVDQVRGLAGDGFALAAVQPAPAADDAWSVTLTHPTWGDATVSAPRTHAGIDETILRWGLPALTDAERTRAGLAETALQVALSTPERSVLVARKHLLRWLHRLMSLAGLLALDTESGLFWSAAMLDDELAHDAELDIEALYTIHAVYQEIGGAQDVYWLHTHGLAELGAFDIDVLRPSAMLSQHTGDPLRALAFAALEGAVTPASSYFSLAMPGGVIDLVPADEFNATASPADAGLRTHDDAHRAPRAVVCEPRGLLSIFRRRPIPSRFLSQVNGNVVLNFSTAASEQMARRAVRTLDVFKGLLAEFEGTGLPNGLKIAYPTAGDPTGREHLWFEVHGFDGDRVDATLANQPFDVPSLTAGARGWHPVEQVSDWIIASPAGSMTPRNLSAARRLRESGFPGGPFGDMVDSAKHPAA
jgi:uncharacterized protein YegJ (DUF2314 family)